MTGPPADAAARLRVVSEGNRQRSGSTWWVLGLIVVGGAAVRLYGLNAQGLWHDEAGSVLVSRAPLGEMFGYFLGPVPNQPFELNPPLYYYLLHGWMALLGAGDLQARLFSATMGIAALPLMFLLGEEMYDTRAGLYAAALLAVSQLGVMFSQEVRAYELIVPLLLIAVRAFLRARNTGRRADWATCVIAGLLMVGTHYHAALAVIALALFVLLRWRHIPRAWVASATLAAAATLGPWAWVTIAAQLRKASAEVMPSYYTVGVWTPITLLNRFNNGAFNGLLTPAPRWSFIAGGVLLSLPILLMLVRALGAADRRERDSTLFGLLLFVVPVTGTLAAATFLRVQYDIRYAAFAVAPYYVLAGAGLSRIRHAVWSVVAICTVLAYSLLALSANYWIPYKENYRDAIRFVDARATPDDCYAFIPFGNPPFQWSIYSSRIVGRRVTYDTSPTEMASCARLWVLTYSRVEVGNETRWRVWREQALADLVRAQSAAFFWIRAELFVRPGTNGQRPETR